ncbi:uncharacterized protein [Amphiura filiformis]|uniref:uncharacterized protein n=1 Tax=Amphiura filiformis TaxID=82378 RepID=UPI003B226997
MERFKCTALSTFPSTATPRWYRYVDDTWIIIKSNELDMFFNHINQVDPYRKLTQEGLSDNELAFLDCLVSVKEDRALTDTHGPALTIIRFQSPASSETRRGQYPVPRAESIITKDSNKIAEHQHLRKALTSCG